MESTAVFFAVVVPILCIGLKRIRDDVIVPVRAFVRIRRAVEARQRNKIRDRSFVEAEILGLDPKLFTKMFRMSPVAFETLHDLIRPVLRQDWTPKSQEMAELSSGSCVETIVLLAGTIRWLAGGSLWDIAFMFRISYSTIHSRKWDVINAINRVLHGNIDFPKDAASLAVLASGFAAINKGMGATIPGVVAAVDSVCVQRKAPHARKSDTGTFTTSIAQAFNRKGYFATTVLAFVDANMRFLSVSMSCYSSSHDSTLFSCSSTGNYIASGQLDSQWLIVADDAFVCKGNIITPYVKHSLSMPQRNYNYFLSMLRQVVERSFALWKGKWGVFWRPIDVHECNIKPLIEVTCRLHNYCIDSKCSANLESCVCHDDVFWERTAAARMPQPVAPCPVFDVHWSDAVTVAAHTGVPVDTACERTTRQRVCQHVAATGNQAPDHSKKMSLNRVNGTNKRTHVVYV
jgi:hypothetical protein